MATTPNSSPIPATINLDSHGRGTVSINGTGEYIDGPDLPTGREKAKTRVMRASRTTGRTVEFTVTEPTGTRTLLALPNGHVSSLVPQEPTPDTSEAPSTLHIVPSSSTTSSDSSPWITTEADHVTAPGKPAPRPEHDEDTDSDSRGIERLEATLMRAFETTNSDASHDASQAVPEADPYVPSPPDPVDADPRWADIAAEPATEGIRGSLNRLGMKFAPDASEVTARREELRATIQREEESRREDEQRQAHEYEQETRRQAREREAAERDRAQRDIIQTNYGEPKTVSLMNDKGGVGKTTDELCIANALGQIRGGDVVAWDANETRGTLGFRARKDNHRRNVVDFLNEAAGDFTTVEGSKRSTLTRYTRQQGDSKFSVLASDESREKQDQVDGQAFRTVHEILSRFYSLILVDTGNNHQVEHFRAALAATDQLVIPVSPGEDGAYAAELMIDNFIGWGYGDLVKNAVVLLHDSATQHGDARAIAAKFENRVRAILPIPFDPILDAGGEIDFDALQPATLAAYQTAAAAISHGLADTKENQ